MSHAQAFFVDRTDWNQPIPKQQIHRESITGPARTKTPKSKPGTPTRRREDYLENLQLPSTIKNDRKKEQNSAKKQRRRDRTQAQAEAQAEAHEEAKQLQEEYDNLQKEIQREKQEMKAQYDQLEKEMIEKQVELREVYDQLPEETRDNDDPEHGPYRPSSPKHTRPPNYPRTQKYTREDQKNDEIADGQGRAYKVYGKNGRGGGERLPGAGDPRVGPGGEIVGHGILPHREERTPSTQTRKGAARRTYKTPYYNKYIA